MSLKKRNNPRNDLVEVREDSAGCKAREKGKKSIQKRKFVLEFVLGFSLSLLTRQLPVEALLLLLVVFLYFGLLLTLILLPK